MKIIHQIKNIMNIEDLKNIEIGDIITFNNINKFIIEETKTKNPCTPNCDFFNHYNSCLCSIFSNLRNIEYKEVLRLNGNSTVCFRLNCTIKRV